MEKPDESADTAGEVEWTQNDTTSLFAMVGMYVLVFQEIEGKLDQILLLGWGHENWEESQARLARLSNHDKIEAVRDVVLNHEDFRRVHDRPEWIEEFNVILGELHEERGRRNGIIHSQYLFEFCEHGLPPVRSHRKRTIANGNAFEFGQEILSKEVQARILDELGSLRMKANFLHVQLVRDYKAPSIGEL